MRTSRSGARTEDDVGIGTDGIVSVVEKGGSGVGVVDGSGSGSGRWSRGSSAVSMGPQSSRSDSSDKHNVSAESVDSMKGLNKAKCINVHSTPKDDASHD